MSISKIAFITLVLTTQTTFALYSGYQCNPIGEKMRGELSIVQDNKVLKLRSSLGIAGTTLDKRDTLNIDVSLAKTSTAFKFSKKGQIQVDILNKPQIENGFFKARTSSKKIQSELICALRLDLQSVPKNAIADIKSLDKNAFGVIATKMQAKDIVAYLKAYGVFTTQDTDADFAFKVDEFDNEAGGFGLLTRIGQSKLVDLLDSNTIEDETELKSRNNKINQAIANLLKTKGMYSAVSPMGHSYCGVSFASLLLIDTVNGIVYEITFGESGSC